MFYVIEKDGRIVYGPAEWRPHGDLAKRAGLRGNAAPAVPLALTDGETLRAVEYAGDEPDAYQTGGEAAPVIDGDRMVIERTVAWKDADTIRASKLAEIAAKRWEVENAGITLADGTVIPTDDRAKTLLGNAKMLAEASDPDATRAIKSASGWVDMTNADIIRAWRLIAAHVQACFDAEREHAERLDALTDPAALAGYDITTGWPNGNL